MRERRGFRRSVFRFFDSLPIHLFFAVVMAVAVGQAVADGNVPRVIVFGLLFAVVLLHIGWELQHRSRIKHGRSRKNS